MLIKNMDETLVNGTMGKVIAFVDPAAPPDDEGGLLGGKPSSKGTKEVKTTAALGGRQLLPLVEFLQPGGLRKQVIVTPENWKVELPSGEVQVSRTQGRLWNVSRSTLQRYSRRVKHTWRCLVLRLLMAYRSYISTLQRYKPIRRSWSGARL
ncbi:hypothetical protein BD414DRAFT_204381 [Trametes punicea]|nr:hypothetical protein BD414DRAFT_204381 [Trametes punicea]